MTRLNQDDASRSTRRATGKHTRNPGYVPDGGHWTNCDICGSDVRAKDAKTTWDNKTVCPKDWERRHPQDFVKAKQDKITPEDGFTGNEEIDLDFRQDLPTYPVLPHTAIPTPTFDTNPL